MCAPLSGKSSKQGLLKVGFVAQTVVFSGESQEIGVTLMRVICGRCLDAKGEVGFLHTLVALP